MKKNAISIVLIVCATMQAGPIPDGLLDNSFGTEGIVITDIAGGIDIAHAALLQPDGKIVAAGQAGLDFALARYNSDGSLDSSFGTAGKVTTDFAGGTDIARAALLQPDGKIVAVGQAGPDFGLVRYNSDGSLDSSFGTGGIVTTDFEGDNDRAFAAILQSDGKIIAVGDARVGVIFDFALARYNSDGSLDTSFGTGGKVTTDFNGGVDKVNAVLLQPDGKIVGVGVAGTDFALARYNSDGSLDSSFGTAGKVTTDLGGNDEANAAILQSDGKIIAVGLAGTDFGLVRYNSDGSLDSSFGTGGIVTTDFEGDNDRAFAAILQSDGKIIAVGDARVGVIFNFALARYNSDGSLDTSFGTGGKVTTDFNGGNDGVRAAILQSDGKFIAVGQTTGGGTVDFALARYLVPSLEISQLAKDFRSKYYLLLNPNYSH